MICVLVADDQPMVRAGFRMLLTGEENLQVVAEAGTGLDAVNKAARFNPTVVVMDIRMPELDGLEATRRIVTADPAARVLILTTFGLDEYVYEALNAGASGFVLKDDPPEQLIAAIRTVAAGEALLSPAVTRRVIQHFTRIPRREPPKGFDELTEREQEVFPGGRPWPLERRDRPRAKTHVTHVLQKLDLRDRVQAVELAYKAGLVEGGIAPPGFEPGTSRL
jgi:DNA-binding NarL/FixJ family response regulator